MIARARISGHAVMLVWHGVSLVSRERSAGRNAGVLFTKHVENGGGRLLPADDGRQVREAVCFRQMTTVKSGKQSASGR